MEWINYYYCYSITIKHSDHLSNIFTYICRRESDKKMYNDNKRISIGSHNIWGIINPYIKPHNISAETTMFLDYFEYDEECGNLKRFMLIDLNEFRERGNLAWLYFDLRSWKKKQSKEFLRFVVNEFHYW